MKINFDSSLLKVGPLSGFKSFNLDKTNCYGIKFAEGKEYFCDGKIVFGPHGNGYHFSERMEDTIRYSGNPGNGAVRDVLIAKVVGSGSIATGFDEYNDYYDMYSCSKLFIEKFLTRDEVISLALSLSELRMSRFVSLYRLSKDEIELFKNKSYMVDRTIEYYQNYTDINNVLKYEIKRNR